MLNSFTRKENEVSKLEKEIESLIWELVETRKQERSSSSSEKDLMHYLLEAAESDENLGKELSRKFIVDNCKNIYFAGHETTAVATSMCLMILALHPEWQISIREEVAQFCPNGIPNADSIPNLRKVHTNMDFFPFGEKTSFCHISKLSILFC